MENATDAGDASEVVIVDSTLFDATRGRVVPYRIYAPMGVSGSVPLVLVSHGGSGSLTGYTTGEHIGTALAAAGLLALYVGHLESSSATAHVFDRPADVSFVLDQLEDDNIEFPRSFTGSVDPGRVGHTGHSYGAYTSHAVGGATFERTFTDYRVIAIAPISPQGADQFGAFDRGPTDNTWMTVAIPSYNLVGADELDTNAIGTIDEPNWRLTPFNRYGDQGDKFLTIVEDQDHREMWNRGSDEVKQYIADQLVKFFTVYVKGESPELACEIGIDETTVINATTDRVADAQSTLIGNCSSD